MPNDYAEPVDASGGAIDTGDLNPIFASRIQQLQHDAQLAGIPNRLISAFRSNGVQAKLFAKYMAGTGNIAARAGQSYHNYGLAADIVANDPSQQNALIAMSRQPWRGIAPGADFNDPNHFQMATGDVPNALAYAKTAKAAPAVAAITSPQAPPPDSGENLLKAYTKSAIVPAATPVSSTAPALGPDLQGELLLKAYSKPTSATIASSANAPGVADYLGKGQLPPDYAANPGKNANVPNDTVDRSQPIGQQLATAGKNAVGYVGGQIAGIPAAIGEDFANSSALNVQGNAESAAGKDFPSFPSADPRSWEAGGVLKSLAGMAGQVSAPLTGIVRKAVQEPTTEATGSPAIGEAAGVVANSAIAPLIGPALGSVGSKLASTAVGDISPETAQLASIARDKFNIPVNAGQMSDSPAVRFAASVAGKAPFSGAGPARDLQQTAFNRAVSNTFGENAEKITPNVMASAKTRLGNEFDTVAANTTVKTDPKFYQDLHDTLNDAQLTLPKAEAEPLFKQAQNIMQKIDPNTGVISGDTYQALTRKGTPLSNAMSSADPNVKFYASQLKEALDGAMQRSASPDMAKRLSVARTQYKAMKTVEDLAEKSTTGDISPASLLTPVRGSYGNMAYGGGGDLADLARIGQRFLKEPPSSGTAERLTAGDMFRRIGMLGMGAVGANEVAPNLISSLPENAIYAAAAIPATLGVGRVASSALRSNWLANNMINRSLGRVAPAALNSPRNLITGAIAGAGGLGSQNKIINAAAPSNQ